MSILGITDTDNLISSALWHGVKLGKDVPNEIQGDIGTNVPWYCVTLSLYYNFLYLHNNQPETNGLIRTESGEPLRNILFTSSIFI